MARTARLVARKARITRALDRRDRLAWRLTRDRWTPTHRLRRMRLWKIDAELERRGWLG